MLTKAKFDELLRRARDPPERIATFGALLSRETRLGQKLVVAGDSAIVLYSQGRFGSEDVDLVGEKTRIVPVLKRWAFLSESDADGRTYWRRDDLSLVVDLADRPSSSGRGRARPIRKVVTPAGPVWVSGIEDLIIRRLVFWSRGGRSVLLDQAVALFVTYRDEIDLGYLEGEVRYERLSDVFRELRRLADAARFDHDPIE